MKPGRPNFLPLGPGSRLAWVLGWCCLVAAIPARAGGTPGDSATPKLAAPKAAKARAQDANPAPDKRIRKDAVRSAPEAVSPLRDAAIARNLLRVELASPSPEATVALYGARGELIYKLEGRGAEALLPLQGVPRGFLYLSVRDGAREAVKKLLYTGTEGAP